jgi:FkbM family methyltransferase
LRQFLPSEGIIIDVGSHMGIYTLLLAEKFRGGLCLEPADDNFMALENNLFINRLKDFSPIKAAASDKNELIPFITKALFQVLIQSHITQKAPKFPHILLII